jgi:hypothetical protein
VNDTKLKQQADFLSIAVECIDDGNNDVAIDFIEDVAGNVEDKSRAATLEEAVEYLEEDDSISARSSVEEVSAELLEEIDSI